MWGGFGTWNVFPLFPSLSSPAQQLQCTQCLSQQLGANTLLVNTFLSCCFFFSPNALLRVALDILYKKKIPYANLQRTRSPTASPPSIWVPSWRWLKRPELPPCCVLPAETRTRRYPGSRTCFLWTSAAATGASNSSAQVQLDFIWFNLYYSVTRPLTQSQQTLTGSYWTLFLSAADTCKVTQKLAWRSRNVWQRRLSLLPSEV